MRARPRDGDDWAQNLFARAREGLLKHRDGGESEYEHRQAILMQKSAAIISRCRAASATPLAQQRCNARHASSVREELMAQAPRHEDEHASRRDGIETLSHRSSSTCATASEHVFGRTVTEGKTSGYDCAFCSHGWDGIQEQLSAIEQRLDASTRDLHAMREWMGRLEARFEGAPATDETEEGGAKLPDLATSAQPLEDVEDAHVCAVVNSDARQHGGLDESKFEALRCKVEELFAEMHGDVNSRLAAIADCLKEEADRNVADMVSRIDQRLLVAASQMDAFLSKSDMQLVGGAQRAAHLLDFSEFSQARTANEVFCEADLAEVKSNTTVESVATSSGAEDLRPSCTDHGITSGYASLSLAVAAAAEAAAAPIGDPLSSSVVLKARMAALLTHIAEVIE